MHGLQNKYWWTQVTPGRELLYKGSGGTGRTGVRSAKGILCKGLSQPGIAQAFKLVHAQSSTSEHTAGIRQRISP